MGCSTYKAHGIDFCEQLILDLRTCASSIGSTYVRTFHNHSLSSTIITTIYYPVLLLACVVTREASGHIKSLSLSRLVLNILLFYAPAEHYTSCDSLSGGLDYHEAIDVGSGTDSPLMSCSYSLIVTIPAGDNVSVGVVVIINDTIYEGEEEFFLLLSIPTAFQALMINEGSPLKATVTIQDDDGKEHCNVYKHLLKFTDICSKPRAA